MIPSLEDKPRFRLHLDKVLFGLSCLYLGGVLVWLVTQSGPRESSAKKTPISPQDAQFIAYLEKSLDVIDKEKTTSPTVAVAPPPMVERIYVPVYPPTPVAPPPPPIPSARPIPKPVARTTAIPPLSIPLPTRIPPPPPTSVPVLTPGKTLLPTQAGYTLVGVMELGDRSMALVDFQGITKRLTLGEIVGNWQIVGIQNQQITLSHNGSMKTLNVGQSF